MAEVKVRKKDIQEAKRPDVVLQGATSLFDWILEHRNAVIGGLAAVLLVVGGISVTQSVRHSKMTQVGGKLGDAIALDSRPVAATKTAEAKSGDDDSFATQADKDKAVQEALTAVTKDFSGTTSASSASLMLASQRYAEGKYDEAISLAQGYLSNPEGGTLKAFALQTLGNAYAAKNDLSKAEDAYKQLGDAGEPAEALFLQGTLKEKAGKTDEARKIFEKVIADYEKESVAKDARAHLDLLQLPPPGVGALEAPAAPASDEAKADAHKPARKHAAVTQGKTAGK